MNSRRRRSRPAKQGAERDDLSQPAEEQEKRDPQTYGVLFFRTLDEAKANKPNIIAKSKEVDQLNVVIESDDIAECEDIEKHCQIYWGDAWTTAHKRRVDEGWYESPH